MGMEPDGPSAHVANPEAIFADLRRPRVDPNAPQPAIGDGRVVARIEALLKRFPNLLPLILAAFGVSIPTIPQPPVM